MATLGNWLSPHGSSYPCREGVDAGSPSLGLCDRPGNGWLSSARCDRHRDSPPFETSEAQRSRALLETILTPISKLKAQSWAEDLLVEFGTLAATFKATTQRLESVLENTEAVGHLSVIQKAFENTLRQEAFEKPIISSSTALENYLRLMLRGEHTEQLRGLFLNSRNNLLGDVLLAKGSIDEVPVSPREIVRCALSLSATSIILVHNHPSGDPTPSQADIDGSHRVHEAAALFDIDLHDHLIVGTHLCFSLAAQGLLKARR